MSDHALSHFLSDLEQRLHREKTSHAKRTATEVREVTPGRRMMGLAFQLSFRFVAPLCLLGGAGIILDDLLLTAPVFQISLFVIGAVIGFRTVYHTVHHQLEQAGVTPHQLPGFSAIPLVPGKDSSGYNSPRGM